MHSSGGVGIGRSPKSLLFSSDSLTSFSVSTVIVPPGGLAPRLKQISSESIAVFYIIVYDEKIFPEYIRLGKFNTKCKIKYEEIKNYNIKEGVFHSKYVLNVLDIPLNINLLSYKIIPIKPVQIIENSIFEGKYIEFETDCLPYNMRYFGGE